MCQFVKWHKTPWIHPDLVPYYIRGWAILYTNSHTPNVMKLFVTKFYQTLILNVATIAAIVVGIVQFLVRAYKENNGPEKVRKVMQTVLKFVNTIVGDLQYQLNTGVPVEKVAQRRTKRSWTLLFYIRTWDTNPMFEELWSEIQDAPGEIFDLPELRELDEEKFNLNDYLNSNIDYWWKLSKLLKSSASSTSTFPTKLTWNESFNSELYWWRCYLPWVGWRYFYSHYCGECVPFLLQFSPA